MINKLVKYSYIGLMGLVVLICLFFAGMEYAYKKAFNMPSFLYFIIGIAVIVVLGLIAGLIEKHSRSEKAETIIVIAVSALWFGLSIIAAHFYYFISGWDVRAVTDTAIAIASGDSLELYNPYFSICSNNIFCTCLFAIVIKLGFLLGYNNAHFLLVIFQCFTTASSGALLFFSIRKLSGRKDVAYLSWFIFLILCGLSPWVVVPYTDTIGLFFLSIVLFLYAFDKLSVLLGFFLITGYYIKPCVLIFGIAVAITHAPELIKQIKKNHTESKEKNKKLILKMAMILGGIVLGFVFVKVSTKVCKIEIDSDRSFGVAHYVMMGLNEERNGAWLQEDQTYSLSIADPKERTRENIRVSFERVRNKGFFGMMKHFSKKALTSYNDGSFAWGEEGSFFDTQIWTGHEKIEDVFRGFYYPSGKRYNLFLNAVQSVWMGVLLFSLIGGFGENDQKVSAMMLTLIGALLFELLFEPRARHLFSVLPIIFYVASKGYFEVMDHVKKHLPTGSMR